MSTTSTLADWMAGIQKRTEAALAAGLAVWESAASLEEAVERAYALSQPGDTVLLSPACASQDMFRDYKQRGELFVQPGDEVYEGMVVGENARDDEMVVNAVRAKEKTNIRTHSHDDGVKLAAPKIHTLETAIEWIADDELVEVTPKAIRIRKRHLGLEDRRKAFKQQKSGG